MVITTLEAHVAPDKAIVFEAAYKEAIRHLDAGITQTFLIHDLRDSSLWQIITFWESREALETMRKSGETPRGVIIFKAADAEPKLTIFDVAAHAAI
jgi:heme-degrading monooxygenase HmoA